MAHLERLLGRRGTQSLSDYFQSHRNMRTDTCVSADKSVLLGVGTERYVNTYIMHFRTCFHAHRTGRLTAAELEDLLKQCRP